MRDLIDDPHPSYTAAMMADLTGKPERPRKSMEEIMANIADRYPVIMAHLARAERDEAALAATAADLTGQDRPTDRMGEPVAGFSGGPATCVHAGAAEGAGRADLERPSPWTRESAAVSMLQSLGYEWQCGRHWAPPRGRARLVRTQGGE